jgi:hypothetical protein
MSYLKKETIDINKEIQEWTTDEWQEYYESNAQLPSDTYDGEIWEEY